jgi:aminopeptidase YwaD
MSLVSFLEQRFRTPGNLPYRESLDELERRLRDAGFGSAEALRLERWTLEENAPTWEPLSASLAIVEPSPEELLSFSSGADRDRTMLLVGSPGTAGRVEAELILEGQGDPKGRAVLAAGTPERAYDRLAEARAAVVLFSADARLEGDVATDDAIPFGYVDGREDGPVGLRLSRLVERRLRELLDKGKTIVLRVEAAVRTERAAVEMLHAEIRGGPLPGLAFAAHLDEPGAEDNASGVAVAVALAGLFAGPLRQGDAPSPNRSLHFVVGPELDHAEEAARRLDGALGWAVALDQVGRPVGRGPFGEPTRALVERAPDPSQRWPEDVGPGSGWLLPGEAVDDSWTPAPPSLLADVLVGLLIGAGEAWQSHPYEGGSDHVPFLVEGIPSALVWKFPDPTYHTSLDRMGPRIVAEEELASVGRGLAALIASLGWEDGSAVAWAARTRLELRMAALVQESQPDAACAWGRWLEQAVRDDLARMLGPLAAAEATAEPLEQLEGWVATLRERCAR